MKKWMILGGALAAAANAFAAALDTGADAPELAVSEWVKGSVSLAAQKQAGRVTVLVFWTTSKRGSEPIPMLNQLADRFHDKADFVMIGCDPAKAIKEFDGVKDIAGAVGADRKLETLNTYMRGGDSVPFAAVIDAKGRLVWRGRPAKLDGLLSALFDGSFDLQKNIGREKFAVKLSETLNARNFKLALKMIDDELEANPGNPELCALKAKLLSSTQNDLAGAIAALEVGIKANPDAFGLYAVGLSLLRGPKQTAELAAWYDRIAKNFSDNPALLTELARKEMAHDMADIRLENALKLSEAAWHAKRFSGDVEQGLAGLEYARALYFCGAPAKALAVAKQSMQLLKNNPEGLKTASDCVKYYHTVTMLSERANH
ncbi:MAG: hypothetical protein PHI35_00975 [Victivallaceae bacterium]|nr:hypothetical protein [Victivallaceae bacterium]